MPVNEMLKYNTSQTLALLKKELEIRKGELMEKILFSSLEKIFIENRIYRDIEQAETWDEVIARIDKGLKPHKKKFYREITTDDIVKLTEIKIKRISKFDGFKADELLRDLEKELKEAEYNLKHLTDYAIAYFQKLLEKYGKGRERKTEIKSFQSVTATEVIAINQKLYVNRADGFIGYGLRKDEYVCDCSELDDVIAIRKDGKAYVARIQEKVFVGKDILFVGIWRKGDERKVYNVVYTDAKSGKGFAKRFNLPGVIRDKEYDLTQGHPNSKIHYVSGNPNGEAEVVEVKLSQSSTARKKVFEYDFAELEVKGRSARGNTITKYPIRKVELLRTGTSTLSKLDLWYDADSGRLNKDKRGRYLGKFDGDDQLIAFMRNGSYKITNYDLTNRYEPEKTLLVEKFNPNKPVSAVYVDGESKQYMVKRFMIETSTIDKEFGFISETIGSRLVVATTSETPEVEVEIVKGKDKGKESEVINLEDLIDVKGWKALGNRLSQFKVTKVSLMEDEEAGPEEPDAEADDEATDSEKDSQSSKKKEQPTEQIQRNPSEAPDQKQQQSLFAEAPKPPAQAQPKESQPKPKVKAEQQSLFGESPQREKEKNEVKPPQNVDLKGKGMDKTDGKGDKEGGKEFGVGDTIEFEI